MKNFSHFGLAISLGLLAAAAHLQAEPNNNHTVPIGNGDFVFCGGVGKYKTTCTVGYGLQVKPSGRGKPAVVPNQSNWRSTTMAMKTKEK